MPKAKAKVVRKKAVKKVIKPKRVVFTCIGCGRNFIDNINTEILKCSYCGQKDTIVIVNNLTVRE